MNESMNKPRKLNKITQVHADLKFISIKNR